ncbi:MAG: hypothetical protein ACLQU1_18930 [Bryobacteraceae bacterium]
MHHWKSYLKLDNSGQWAEIARRQLERLRQNDADPLAVSGAASGCGRAQEAHVAVFA